MTTKEKFKALTEPQKQSLIGKVFAVVNHGAKESASDILVTKIYKALSEHTGETDKAKVEQLAREKVCYQVRVPSVGSDEDNRIEFMYQDPAGDVLLFWMFEENPIWQNVRRGTA